MTYREIYAKYIHHASLVANVHNRLCPTALCDFGVSVHGATCENTPESPNMHPMLCKSCWDQEIPGGTAEMPTAGKPVCTVDRSKLLITLEKCRNSQGCSGCQYYGLGDCVIRLAEDSLAYISYLEEVLGV